ncbi:hypothetical protein QL285_043966 [Trifolium repens]|nr:hypothetical protein QL285_043966 [Trifolium repens]
MFSINPSMYVGLRNPKKQLPTPENAKQHHIYAYLRPGALTRARGRAMAPAPETLRPGARRPAPWRPHEGSPCLLSAACCLLSPHQGTPASSSIIFKAISNINETKQPL